MIALLTAWVGPRLARPVLYVLLGLALVATLAVGKCVLDRRQVAQAEQTTRSADAIADAAQDAVATVTNRADTEQDIDAVVSAAAQEIDNAPNATAAHDAAMDAACMLAEYRNDPSCTVR